MLEVLKVVTSKIKHEVKPSIYPLPTPAASPYSAATQFSPCAACPCECPSHRNYLESTPPPPFPSRHDFASYLVLHLPSYFAMQLLSLRPGVTPPLSVGRGWRIDVGVAGMAMRSFLAELL
jgi:hypothetical protein